MPDPRRAHRATFALAALLACVAPSTQAQPAVDAVVRTAHAGELAGLCKARRWFGPIARDTLAIRRDGDYTTPCGPSKDDSRFRKP